MGITETPTPGLNLVTAPPVVRNTNRQWRQGLLRFDVSDYGWVNNGSSNNDAAIAALLADLNSAGLTETRQAIVSIPGASSDTGGYAFATRFRWPRWVNIDGAHAVMLYTGADYAGPAITVGQIINAAVGSGWAGSMRLPSLRCTTLATHRCSALTPTMNLELFAGYAFELCRTDIYIPLTLGFAVNHLFMPGDGGYTFGNRLYVGRSANSRKHFSWRGNVNSSWANENAVARCGDIGNDASFQDCGNAWAFAYSAEPGGYAGLSGNNVASACVQLNVGRSWPSAGTAATAGIQWLNPANGRFYEAQGSGTAGTAPTHSDGGTVGIWKDLGPHRRQIALFENAGNGVEIMVERWESGYGPTAQFRGDSTVQGGSIRIRTKNLQAVTVPPNMPAGASTGLEIWPTTLGAAGAVAASAQIEFNGRLPDINTGLPQAQDCFIGNAAGVWTASRGYSLMQPNTAGATPVREISGAALTLCEDGVVGVGGAAPCLGVIASLSDACGAIDVDYGAGHLGDVTNPPRFRVRPLDNSDTAMVLTAGDKVPVFISGAIGRTGTAHEAATGDSYLPRTVLRNDAAVFGVFIGLNDGKVGSINVNPRHTPDLLTGSTSPPPRPPVLRTPYTSTGRACNGPPTAGRFFNVGEYIEDSSGKSGGHVVVVAGILAPAFTAGETSIPRRAYRVAGGNAYYLNSATATATAGATAPTGTSTTADVSDGTNGWRYRAPVAVIEPLALPNIGVTFSAGTAGTSAATALAANANGQRARLDNTHATATLFVDLTAGATTSSWAIPPGTSFAPPFPMTNAWSLRADAAGTTYNLWVETAVRWAEPVRTATQTNGTTTGAAQTLATASPRGQYLMFRNHGASDGIRAVLNGTATATGPRVAPGGVIDPDQPVTTNLSIFGEAAGTPYTVITA